MVETPAATCMPTFEAFPPSVPSLDWGATGAALS